MTARSLMTERDLLSVQEGGESPEESRVLLDLALPDDKYSPTFASQCLQIRTIAIHVAAPLLLPEFAARRGHD